MNAKLYSKAVGVVLLLLGVIGLVQSPLMGMDLSKRHSAVHLATGALGSLGSLLRWRERYLM